VAHKWVCQRVGHNPNNSTPPTPFLPLPTSCDACTVCMLHLGPSQEEEEEVEEPGRSSAKVGQAAMIAGAGKNPSHSTFQQALTPQSTTRDGRGVAIDSHVHDSLHSYGPSPSLMHSSATNCFVGLDSGHHKEHNLLGLIRFHQAHNPALSETLLDCPSGGATGVAHCLAALVTSCEPSICRSRMPSLLFCFNTGCS
jgi:hypothetical protein